METAPTYTLREVVEKYLLRQFNDARKHFIKYLAFAWDVWKDIFSNDTAAIKSVYLPVINGKPYKYIEVPDNLSRFISLSIVNPNGSLTPVYYNKNIHIRNRTLINKRCGKCDCDGINHDVDNLIAVSKQVVLDNEVYTEKTWVKVCANGDVIEYRQIPTKKYTTPDAYTIVVHPEQRTICKLQTKPCGCVANTEQNKILFYQNCGCYLIERSAECNNYLCNVTGPAGMKLSECGSKIYLSNVSAPSLLLSYQIPVDECDEEILVPEHAWRTIAFGIEDESKMFNPSVPQPVRDAAHWNYVRAKNKQFLYENMISLSELAEIGMSGKWGGGLTQDLLLYENIYSNEPAKEISFTASEPYTATEIISEAAANKEEIIKINGLAALDIPWTEERQAKFQRFPHLEVWVKQGDGKYSPIAFQPSADYPLTNIHYDFGGNIEGFVIIK